MEGEPESAMMGVPKFLDGVLSSDPAPFCDTTLSAANNTSRPVTRHQSDHMTPRCVGREEGEEEEEEEDI
jgi:hypothetical protein